VSWSHVNGSASATAAGANSVNLTLGWTATAGNILVVMAGQSTGGAVGRAISDTGGNTWTFVGVRGAGQCVLAWYSQLATGGALTITVGFTTTSAITALADEFSFAGTIGVSEGFVSGAGGGSNPTTSAAIVPTGTDLMVTGYAVPNQGGANSTIAAPFSVAPGQVSSSSFLDIATGYALDQTTSQTPVWTLGTSNPSWQCIAWAIKGTPSAAAKIIPIWHLIRSLQGHHQDTP